MILFQKDFRLLQIAREQQSVASVKEIVADIRARGQGLEPDELNDLIEEARAEFYYRQSK